MKRYAYLFIILVVSTLVILSGCEQPNGGDDGTISVGDTLDGGFEVTYVDDGGGYFAERTEDGETQVLVANRFLEDIEFTADKVWLLSGPVFIGNGAQDPANAADNTLTIAAGTEIRGEVSTVSPGLLVIDRGSDIDAQGTASDPIVFTSANPAGEREAGDWGGIIINGYSQVQGGYATGEGGTGEYGGGDSPVLDDNSGTLQYVRVEFAGTLFSPDNELNGISFNGVGSGTTVDYIQVHQNADDGVEFFGGTVDVRHVVLTGNQDDSLDHDDGWDGTAQYVFIQQYPGGDHGIEGDGDPIVGSIDPVKAVLANFTYVGSPDTTDDGFRFRRAAEPTVLNSLITNVSAGETSIDEETTADDGSDESAGTVTYKNVVVTSAPESSAEVDWSDGSDGNSQVANTPFTGWVASLASGEYSFPSDPEYTYGSFDAGAVTVADRTGENGTVVDDTSYVGALEPGGTNWISGWITQAEN